MEFVMISVFLFYTLIVFGFLLFLVLSFRRQPRRYLMIGLLTICFHAAYKIAWWVWAGDYAHELPMPVGWVYPLLLYLFAYTYYVSGAILSLKKVVFLFIPALTIHLFLFIIASYWPVMIAGALVYETVYYVSCTVSLVTCGILTSRLYHRYKGPLTSADTLIRQLTLVCYGLAGLTAMVLYETYVMRSGDGVELRSVVYLFMVISCTLILRYYTREGVGIRDAATHARLRADGLDSEHNSVASSVPAGEQLGTHIERVLHDSELFLNPHLSLDMLAEATAIPRHQLTQVFREYYQKSFYQFVAELRIAYAIEQLSEMKDTVTLDSLSYACGFNSKTSFNRYFKTYTGMTPSEYRMALRSAYHPELSISD